MFTNGRSEAQLSVVMIAFFAQPKAPPPRGPGLFRPFGILLIVFVRATKIRRRLDLSKRKTISFPRAKVRSTQRLVQLHARRCAQQSHALSETASPGAPDSPPIPSHSGNHALQLHESAIGSRGYGGG